MKLCLSLKNVIKRFLPRYAKHIIKRILNLPDANIEFYNFEKKIHNDTWRNHKQILSWADSCALRSDAWEQEYRYKEDKDPLVRQGYQLLQQVKIEFKNKHRDRKHIRVLIHVPSFYDSPGGYSLFSNMVRSFQYLGLDCKALDWQQDIVPVLEEFKPTVFMTSDSPLYLERIDWKSLSKYRASSGLKMGLTASLQEYGNTPLTERLKWAKESNIDFYYSFRAPEYYRKRNEYKPFFEEGYSILSFEFGANPLIYYPVPGIKRDLMYVFLASSNPAKRSRYDLYLKDIFHKYPGFINGPGWHKIKNFTFKQNRDRYIYARGRVGINLHIANQIDWASELNERTYMLAACGVPQLVDNAKLLPKRFSADCFYIGETPKQYFSLFQSMLANPKEAERRALKAQKEVFERHTTFHRVDNFINVFHKAL